VLTPPLTDFGTLSDPIDLETLIAALRITCKVSTTSAMQQLGPVVGISPGANVKTDQQLRVALRELIQQTYSHPRCTCAVMPRQKCCSPEAGSKKHKPLNFCEMTFTTLLRLRSHTLTLRILWFRNISHPCHIYAVGQLAGGQMNVTTRLDL